MKRLPLAAAVLALALPGSALALPGSALAAGTSHGTVLSVDRAHHLVRVVDARHRVHDYSYRGGLARVRPGSLLSFIARGSRITRVRSVKAGSGTVSFYARVVHSSKGRVTLVLADGHRLGFSGHQVARRRVRAALDTARPRRHGAIAHMAASGTQVPVNVNIQGLEPGVTVLVTESVDGSGAVTITITLPPPSVTSAQQFSGVLTDVGQDAFMLQTADGSVLRLHMPASALAAQNLSVCDTVDVTFHQDNDLLVVDSVTVTGSDSSGDCAGGSGGGDNSTDVIGTITSVSASGLTVSSDQGPMTFTVEDPSITDGYQVGDVVDVTYTQSSDGSLDASDVEYSEQDFTGTVTAVSATSLTVSDGNGGSQTFAGDPTQGVFDGVSVGDQVDVTYHMSDSQPVADAVDAQSTDGGGWGGGPS